MTSSPRAWPRSLPKRSATGSARTPARSQMLHAPIMEALEAAFAMGMFKGMAYAGNRLRPPLPDAPEWLERRVTEAIAKSRASKTTTVVAKRPKPEGAE